MSSAKRKTTTGPKPLDLGPLEDSVGYLLRRAQVAIFQKFFEQFDEFDIRPAQYSTLTLIERNPGLSQNQLANALGIKKTNLVAMIDALEKRDLARRKASEKDRRFHALHLTPKGAALVRRLHQQNTLLGRQAMRTISKDERQKLFDLLRRLAEQ